MFTSAPLTSLPPAGREARQQQLFDCRLIWTQGLVPDLQQGQSLSGNMDTKASYKNSSLQGFLIPTSFFAL